MAIETVVDLGDLGPEVWLCGGPYSNLHALRAFEDLVPANTPVVCTGDVCAYCAHPLETVERLRGLGWPVIAGNCDKELAVRSGNCGCGFAEGSACDLASRTWYAHADAALNTAARDWLGKLPDAATFLHGGRTFAVIHGGALAINRFLWPSSPADDFRAEINEVKDRLGDIDGVIAGHCGIAFQRLIDGVHWINAGVLGMPPHDARPETRFAILKDQEVVVHRLTYDADAASEAMRAAGLKQGYERALTSGVWPSEEVLPDVLRHVSLASG